MSIKSRVVSILAVLISAGSLVVVAVNADAAYRRAHSSYCHYYNDAAGTGIYNGSYLSNNTGSGKGIYCPVPTDGYFPHTAVTQINVHGYEASGESNYSRACVKHYNNGGTACGTTRYWGSTYSGGLGVDVSAWSANSASFPYLYNYLDTGGRFYGFYLAN